MTSGLYVSCLWTEANHGLSLERATRAMACLAKQSRGLRSKAVGRGAFQWGKEGEKLGVRRQGLSFALRMS